MKKLTINIISYLAIIVSMLLLMKIDDIIPYWDFACFLVIIFATIGCIYTVIKYRKSGCS
ncbi:hypothetical protein DN752_16755 [Echinicola strongylocentroti]|uniref:Uncharacterized protein n=1 Tax=Echinicola strongylocentroti TaxID=1795355 RepID=A0A2Z4IMM9_9BACT|nr:hypothetical protein DN752_16755 [Echinicola strongylocentroti]